MENKINIITEPINTPTKNINNTIGNNVYISNQNSNLLLKYRSKGAYIHSRNIFAASIIFPVISSRKPEIWPQIIRLIPSAANIIKRMAIIAYKWYFNVKEIGLFTAILSTFIEQSICETKSNLMV